MAPTKLGKLNLNILVKYVVEVVGVVQQSKRQSNRTLYQWLVEKWRWTRTRSNGCLPVLVGGGMLAWSMNIGDTGSICLF